MTDRKGVLPGLAFALRVGLTTGQHLLSFVTGQAFVGFAGVMLPPLMILVPLLASLPLAAVALDPAGPAPLGRATHRQFLPTVQRRYRPPEPCLPAFGEERPLLTIDTDGGVELISTADLNGDGWSDAMVARLLFQTRETFEISILLNDQQGGLVDATHQVFEGPVPRVQHPSKILLRDFNGDGRTDIFIADSGMDTPPHPGYQNTLVLSAPGGEAGGCHCQPASAAR